MLDRKNKSCYKTNSLYWKLTLEDNLNDKYEISTENETAESIKKHKGLGNKPTINKYNTEDGWNTLRYNVHTKQI